MNKKIVILTKSSKFKQYCVAGIDCHTGKWVRLVSTDENTHGALTATDLLYENGQSAELLDVVNVEVQGSDNNPVQPENMIIDRHFHLCAVGKISIEEALKLYSGRSDTYILGNSSYYVHEDNILDVGYSLSIVNVKNLYFERITNPFGNPKIKLSFDYNGCHYTNMSVTDPRFYDINDGEQYASAIIVVSIGMPYNGYHYKFVSAIYIMP